MPIILALATFTVSVAGLALSTKDPSQTLLEIALKGRGLPWAQHATEVSTIWVKSTSDDFQPVISAAVLSVATRAKEVGINVARDIANRDALLHQTFTTCALLRAFNRCHIVVLATAGTFFAVYALHALGVLLGPVVLVIGELANIMMTWFWDGQSK